MKELYKKYCPSCKKDQPLTLFVDGNHQCEECQTIEVNIPDGYKVCTNCDHMKVVGEFYEDVSRTDGIDFHCKECRRAKQRHRNRHPRETHQYKRRWKGYSKTQYMMFTAAKGRAKEKGISFTLSPDDIIIPNMCPILDIDIIQGGNKRSNNSPSLDRIDNSKGYTPDNVIVVSYRANKLKNDATLDELRMLVERYEKITPPKQLDLNW